MKIGIDCIAFDVAKIHLPIQTLAKARNIEPEKLEKGLGLLKMTLPDIHQDTVVFGANALTKLIQDHKLNLAEIARIYVGTESAIDSSKPISSFLIALMEQKFGENTLSHCDVVDFTFACIGGVDAMQNCIDFVTLNPTQKAIVVTTDFAKYDLNSTGEYTQGAGALAMLISTNPRIIAFENQWATSTKGVFDFFKPYRILSKNKITGNETNKPWFENLEQEIEIHKDQPVFDGQYSNQCYMDRTREAYFTFKKIKNTNETVYHSWKSIIMHLPYAFQGRRMLSEIYALDTETVLFSGDKTPAEYQNALKEISKSAEYQNFITQKLVPAELASSLIGNLYTGSIFMGLLSTLSHFYDSKKEIKGAKFGFLAPNVVKVSNPKGKSDSKVSQNIVVTVTKDQKVFIGTQQIEMMYIDSLLKKEIDKDKKFADTPTVVLNIDTSAYYGMAFKIMEAAKRNKAKLAANIKP